MNGGADSLAADSAEFDSRLQHLVRSVTRLKSLLLASLVVPVVGLVGLIATNGFTEGSPAVALVGLAIGLATAAPFCLPPALLLYLQSRYARVEQWSGLAIVSLVLTIGDALLLAFLVPTVVSALTAAFDEGSGQAWLLWLGLVAAAGYAAWRQWQVTRMARRRKNAALPAAAGDMPPPQDTSPGPWPPPTSTQL